MPLVPAYPDPRISPLAAMRAANMTFAQLAKRCGYSESRIRETIRARERSLAACLAGDRRPVAKANRTGADVTRRICHALNQFDIFYSLPGTTPSGKAGQGVPFQTRRAGTAIPGAAPIKRKRPVAKPTGRRGSIV